MGGTSSKFRKRLVNGDEYAVMHIYDKHADLRKSLNPNNSLGETLNNNTFLHYAAKHAITGLVRSFLHDLGGNPNKRNGDSQTALHLVCEVGLNRSIDVDTKHRIECLALLLSWKHELPAVVGDGVQPKDEMKVEEIDLNAVDSKKFSALHYAAAHGLQKCCEMLLYKGADIFAENELKETPADCAQREGHFTLLNYLESRMVFSPGMGDDTMNEDELFPVAEVFSGLREQDLREAKDQLLVETSDMFHVPLFTAEALLRNHEWSRDELWDAWEKNPISACEKSGVPPPPSALEHARTVATNSKRIPEPLSPSPQSKAAVTPEPVLESKNRQIVPDLFDPAGSRFIVEVEHHRDDTIDASKMAHSATVKNPKPRTLDLSDSLADRSQSPTIEVSIGTVEQECTICACLIVASPIRMTCAHLFCGECWKSYLTGKIQEGDLNNISCPGFNCSKLVPIEIIERIVSPSVARKYLKFDIKAFVESNPKIKWCPYPGCTNAVRLPEQQEAAQLHIRAFPRLPPPPATSRTVYCLNAHGFCWDCLAEGHEPTSCERWKDWHDRIALVKPEELKGIANASETAANCLWLVTHSKPCPKCKSPIQKNEGCNHMKCSKCKSDFCWVCLGPWKKHNTDTGGYFRCNRYEDTRKHEERTEAVVSAAKEQSKKTQELNKFVHYYTRYKNHLNSYTMEQPLVENLDERTESLKQSALEFQSVCEEEEQPTTSTSQSHDRNDQVDLAFVKTAILELLRSRKVLSSSYAYGYFLKDCGYNKTIFEYLQNELEVAVENLSAMVGRNYLRSSRTRIVQTTALVAQRRHTFILCISRGLLPPETPPALRRLRKRHIPGLLGIDVEDEDWTKAGLPAEEDINPDRPWVKDNRGRHRNVLTMLDWPDDIPDSDDEPDAEAPAETVVAADNANAVPHTLPSGAGTCERKGCAKLRVKNPRTGVWHLYCSQRCLSIAMLAESTGSQTGPEFNVDLMIAMQMSRLQLLRDLNLLYEEQDLPTAVTPRLSQMSNVCRQLLEPSPDEEEPGVAIAEDIDPDIQMAIERSISDLPLCKDGRNDSSGLGQTGQPLLDTNEQVLKLLVRRFTQKDSDSANAVNLNETYEPKIDENTVAHADKLGGKALLSGVKCKASFSKSNGSSEGGLGDK